MGFLCTIPFSALAHVAVSSGVVQSCPSCVTGLVIDIQLRSCPSLSYALRLVECVSRPEAVWLCWQVLVASHKAWLKLQRCKDRFEPLLCLDALKDCSDAPAGAAVSPSKAGTTACNGSTAAGSGMPGCLQTDVQPPLELWLYLEQPLA